MIPFTEFSLYTSIGMALAAIPLLLMLYASARGYEDSILCMDCQQCVGVCPVRETMHEDYLGPRGIEIAARAGNLTMAEDGMVFSCTSCMSCVDRCPRKLNVKHAMDKLRGDLAKRGRGQMKPHKHIVKMATTYGNVYEEKPRKKPPINDQKEKVIKFMKNYAKITRANGLDFGTGEGKDDGKAS